MISLIHPSRSRPDKSWQTIKKWVDSTFSDDFEVITSFDSDDPHLPEYQKIYFQNHFAGFYTINDNRGSVDAINNAVKVARGDIFIVVSDDTDCAPMWDQIILAAVASRKDFVLKVNDGIQKHIVTMPILDRTYYNRTGHIYHPAFRHQYADTYFTLCAKRSGRLIVRNDIMFRHLHPEATGEPKDELYLRNDATIQHGRDTYKRLTK
jgi:glycosyltransferase involved in cell wall biosynthesis